MRVDAHQGLLKPNPKAPLAVQRPLVHSSWRMHGCFRESGDKTPSSPQILSLGFSLSGSTNHPSVLQVQSSSISSCAISNVHRHTTRELQLQQNRHRFVARQSGVSQGNCVRLALCSQPAWETPKSSSSHAKLPVHMFSVHFI